MTYANALEMLTALQATEVPAVASSVFLLMCDVHYQANTLATKNRAPDFYA